MRLPCGCRKATTKKHGHRPVCEHFDQEKFAGHRSRRRMLRKMEDRTSSVDHARGVTLWT